jgi:phage terminase small subunit
MNSFDDIPANLKEAPGYLRPQIREFFRYHVTNSPDLWDAAARSLLVQYCKIWNQLEDVREERTAKNVSPTFNDKHGQPRIHPLVKHEMELTNEFGKLFRLLGFDQTPRGKPGEPFR